MVSFVNKSFESKMKVKLSTKQSLTKDLLNITPYEFLMKINKSEEPMLGIKAGK